MTKTLSHNALDAALDYVASRGDMLALCAGAPANADEATTAASEGGRMLALRSLNTGLGNGDYIAEPGQVSGRRLVVRAQPDLAISEAGIADHLVLVDSAGGELLLVTPLTEPQPVTAGTVVSLRSFSDEIADPV